MSVTAENHQNNKGMFLSETKDIKLVALGIWSSTNKDSSDKTEKQMQRPFNSVEADCFFSISGVRGVYLDFYKRCLDSHERVEKSCPSRGFSVACLVQYCGQFSISQSEMVARLSPESSLLLCVPGRPHFFLSAFCS